MIPGFDGALFTAGWKEALWARYFHIGIAEVRTEQGKLYLLVAIDCTSKFAFTDPKYPGSAVEEVKLALACAQNDIDHRLTKPRHPWTNGQVERMNRTIKEATVKRCHYETHDQLRQHLSEFIAPEHDRSTLSVDHVVCERSANWAKTQLRGRAAQSTEFDPTTPSIGINAAQTRNSDGHGVWASWPQENL